MRQYWTAGAAIVLIGSIAGGCKTTGIERAAQARSTLEHLNAELVKGKVDLESTVKALQDLSDGGDLTQKFSTFSDALSDLESQHDDIKELQRELAAKRVDYATMRQEQLSAIQDEELKRRSQEQSDSVLASFDTVAEQRDEALAAFKPLLSRLRDVRAYLEDNLNQPGVESIDDQVKDVVASEKTVQKEVDDVIAEIKKIADRMSSEMPIGEPAAEEPAS